MSHLAHNHAIAPYSHTPSAHEDTLAAVDRADDGSNPASLGVLDTVPASLSDLATAQKLTEQAARVGFDWPDLDQVWGKLQEEVAELEAEIRAADELGDVLFSIVNLARWLNLDAENALRRTNAKFRYRFSAIEQGARLWPPTIHTAPGRNGGAVGGSQAAGGIGILNALFR
jgi:uncharacterized protein YabN with tetrapyrrole methylase and pyrophosphatase domain